MLRRWPAIEWTLTTSGDTVVCLVSQSVQRVGGFELSSLVLDVCLVFVYILFYLFYPRNYLSRLKVNIAVTEARSYHFQWRWSPHSGLGPSAADQCPSPSWAEGRGAPRQCPASRLVVSSQPIEKISVIIKLSLLPSPDWDCPALGPLPWKIFPLTTLDSCYEFH